MTLPLYPLAVRGLAWPVMKTFEFNTDIQQALNGYEVAILNSQNPLWHFTLIYEYLKDDPADLVATLSPQTDYRYLEGFLLSLQGKYAPFLLDDLTDDTFGALSIPGGGVSSTPSVFKPTLYPTQEFYYPLGSMVVSSQSTPTVNQVIQAGVSGGTTPSWSTTTTSGQVVMSRIGNYSGVYGQPLQIVTDGTNYYSPLQRNFGGQFEEDVVDLNQTVYPVTVWDAGVQVNTGYYTINGPGLSVAGKSFAGMYLTWNIFPAYYIPTGPVTALGQFYFRLRPESDQQDIEYFLRNLWTVGGTSGKNGSGMLKFVTRRPNFA